MAMATKRRIPSGVLVVLTGSLVLGAPAVSAADYVGTYMTPDGSMTMEYRDDQNLRVRTADGEHLLISGGSTYVVYQEGGEWLVMPMDAVFGAAGGSAPVEEAEYRMNATGRTEVVAGFQGEIYEVERCDAWSGDCSRDDEVVVSDDPRVANLFAGMQAMSRQMSQHEGDDVLEMPEGMENYGLLRAHGVELQSAEQTRLPDNTFALPPNHRVVDPMAGTQFGGDAPQAPPAGAPESAGEEEPQGGWIGESARGMGREAGEEAEQETRRGVREAVRDGVRGLFE